MSSKPLFYRTKSDIYEHPLRQLNHRKATTFAAGNRTFTIEYLDNSVTYRLATPAPEARVRLRPLPISWRSLSSKQSKLRTKADKNIYQNSTNKPKLPLRSPIKERNPRRRAENEFLIFQENGPGRLPLWNEAEERDKRVLPSRNRGGFEGELREKRCVRRRSGFWFAVCFPAFGSAVNVDRSRLD